MRAVKNMRMLSTHFCLDTKTGGAEKNQGLPEQPVSVLTVLQGFGPHFIFSYILIDKHFTGGCPYGAGRPISQVG